MFKLFVFSAIIALAAADGNAQITNQQASLNEKGDGVYSYSYSTSNGINVQENGVGGQNSQGQAQWYSPEGEPVAISWYADENGARVQGTHIPTPPPVPEAILKAIEYIRTHAPPQQLQQ